MNYDFTDAARKALALAREEAVEHGHDHVDPEHLLLGLLKAGDPRVSKLLAERDVGTRELRASVEARMKPGKAKPTATELPYTPAAKLVLELSLAEARRRRASGMGGVQLLAGLLGEERSIAWEVLKEAGLTLAAAREAAVGEEPVGEGPAGPPLVVLDDASDRSIYEQIVQQIQERVAVGELKPGDRLPTVRRLADGLDIAPGTVARAYSELERLGLVVTRGVRGTRVAKRAHASVPDRERAETLEGLLRPVAVAAFHLGAGAGEVRTALDRAMADIFRGDGGRDA